MLKDYNIKSKIAQKKAIKKIELVDEDRNNIK